MNTKILTLTIILQDGQVLLGFKKRGFGRGLFNGFGGKVEVGESIAQAASRECLEEAGVRPLDLSARGVLLFHFDGDPMAMEVHVFLATMFSGEIRESEEMRPEWFSVNAIPYDNMWPDDKFWLPAVLAGKMVQGTFWFTDQDTLREHTLAVA